MAVFRIPVDFSIQIFLKLRNETRKLKNLSQEINSFYDEIFICHQKKVRKIHEIIFWYQIKNNILL